MSLIKGTDMEEILFPTDEQTKSMKESNRLMDEVMERMLPDWKEQ
jgi:hypothetical protein